MVLEQWAEVTRAVSLLPPTNQRLLDALRRFVHTLASSMGEGNRIAVLIQGTSAFVGDERFEVSSINGAGWLADRLARTGLAGVEFQHGMNLERFLEFTRRLLELWTNRDPTLTFDDFWPDEYEGLRLVELRFDQRGGAGDVRSLLAEGSPGVDRVVRLMRSDAEFMNRLRAIERAFAERGSDGGVDIVERIAALVPEDAKDSEVKVLSLTRSVLATLEEELQSKSHHAESLGALLNNVSRKFFFRDPTEGQSNPASPPADSRQPDPDLDVLVATIRKLPEDLGEIESRLESRAETIDTLMYFLCEHSSEAVADRLQQRLVRMFAAFDAEVQACVEEYLTWARQALEGNGEPRPLRRLLGLLRDSSRSIGMSGAKFLSRRLVVQSFPELFLPYLDAVDLKDPGKAKELASICTEIGPRRVISNRDALFHQGVFRGAGRSSKILALAHSSFLPFVHLILEDEGEDRRKDAVAFLRRLGIRHKESVLVNINSERLRPSVRYLSRLSRFACTGEWCSELHQEVSEGLCVFIQETAGMPEEKQNRLYAISQLAAFPSRRARELLSGLIGDRRFLMLRREDRAIREAARTALSAIGGEVAMCDVGVRQRLPGMTGLVDELVVASVNIRIYPAEHQRVRTNVADITTRLHEMFAENPDDGAVALGVYDGCLVYRDRPLVGASLSASRIIDLLERLQAGGVEFTPGLVEREIASLLRVFAARPGQIRDFKEANEALACDGALHVRFQSRDEAGGFSLIGLKHDLDLFDDSGTVRLPTHLYQGVVGNMQNITVKVCQGRAFDLGDVNTLMMDILTQLDQEPTAMLNLARYEQYDAYTFGHSIRVCFLALNFARYLTSDPETQRRVGLAGLLHDIGKARIPFELLHSTARFTEEERREMEKHVIYGGEILLELDEIDLVAVNAAVGHHRTLEGGGYPRTALRPELSLVTRIVKICDVFEALTAVRPYKASMSPAAAYEIMLNMRGHFDPPLLRRFIQINGLYPDGALVLLSSGETARVERQTGDLRRPVVSTRTDPDGELLDAEDQRVLDLSQLGLRSVRIDHGPVITQSALMM